METTNRELTMHLFFDTVWKLHPGEIPEKPDFNKLKNDHVFKDYKFYTGYKDEDIQQQYDHEIAAIKANALIVGNPEILKQFGYLELPINGDFVKWPGCYETLKTLHCDEYHQHTKNSCFTTVAILTLPEEKKNTMENMTKEQAIEKAAEEYADSIDRRGCAFWRGLNMGYIAGSTASGSVAAPKEHPDFLQWLETEDGKGCMKWPVSEPKYLQNRLFWAFDAGRNCIWDQYVNQKKELESAKEALKELLPIAEKELYNEKSRGDIFLGGTSYEKYKAIIERARKTLNP